jgi:geranylgeranyl pyrophosphate synthase
METFRDFMLHCQQRVESTLDDILPAADDIPQSLHEAMRYASMEGGKRVRPMLVYATGQAVGTDIEVLDRTACAIELIHVYSLIHDDLPAMDNDDLRRGRPTCHKAFDEATAILAGDALQPLAFQMISEDEQLPLSARMHILQTLARASGSQGMAGGQAIDLESEGKNLSLAELENMHARKTGALILASITMGAMSNPQLRPQQLQALEQYGSKIGLAFQIQDDILDEVGETEKLGKPQGSDRSRNKSTFVSLCGLKASQERAETLLKQALDALKEFDGSADMLRDLARYIIQRDY